MDITSKIRTVAIFFTFDFILKTEFVRRPMCMVYICTNFKRLSENGSLVIVIKIKAKHTFNAAAMLFYIKLP
jgi:hypothetical protein